jgi:hypothetical protein
MALTCGARPSASGREGEIGGSAGGSLGQARLGWRPVAVRLKKERRGEKGRWAAGEKQAEVG